jgi:FkbM family methyltransferase
VTVQVLDTIYGRMLVPDTDTAQYPWLLRSGASVEDEYICRVRELLAERPHGTIVDAGACFGCWTLALAASAERVLAFEPQREISDMLRGSLALNRLSRKVTVESHALWSRPAAFDLEPLDVDSPNNFGGAALQPLDRLGRGRFECVGAWPLHHFVAAEECVSLIKMDVEGSEYEVLLGSLEIIARCRPLLFAESDHPGTDKAKLRRQIEAMGYAIEHAGPNFLCLPL